MMTSLLLLTTMVWAQESDNPAEPTPLKTQNLPTSRILKQTPKKKTRKQRKEIRHLH